VAVASRKTKEPKRHRGRIRRVFAGLGIVALVLLLAGAGVAAFYVNSWLRNLPDYSSAAAFQVAQPTRIYSADGKLLARLYLQNREVVPISEISSDTLHAIVAVEDERFYQHGALDYEGLARALVSTLRGNRQGASTLTQQYVRSTVLLDEASDMTLARKVREAYISIKVEEMFSKDEILTGYLNAVYFGEGAYGIEAAAQTYFSKKAKDLTLAEAALLCGIPQSPTRLDPYNNPNDSTARRNHVLDRMLVNGYITQQQHDAAVAVPLQLKRTEEPIDGIYSNPYYVSWVRKLLQDQFSKKTLFTGGLTVYTALDTRIQGYAEKATGAYQRPGKPSVALVCLDPRTGQVRALVGGKDYAKSKFNLVTQGKRQPGSSFKTFVLTTAIAAGISPQFMVDSASPVSIPSKPVWQVSNSEGNGHGMVSLAQATRSSINTAYARVAWELGISNVTATARRMGITTHLPSYPSIALGSVNCTPLEMASAYGTLANRGVHQTPIFITKVMDDKNNLLFEDRTAGTRAIDGSVAYAVTRVLQGVITRGTGTRAYIGRPAAGKTGTSQNNRDAWFVGYTPELVTAVWVGYTPEKTIVVNGSRGFGGTLAAPIWAAFMRSALKGLPIRDFTSSVAPHYDSGGFHPPVSSSTRRALAAKKTVKVYVYSDQPVGTVLSSVTSTRTGITTITISKGPDPGLGGGTTPTPTIPPDGGGGTGTVTP
jgi:1A family penicillin-binding protein